MPQRRPLAFAALALIAVALTGCAQPAKQARPSPTPTPLFATDADALAAATKAYARYLQVTEEVLKDGGRDADRLRAVATGEQLKAELAGFRSAQKNDWTGSGAQTFSGLVDLKFRPNGKVQVQLCENDSQVEIIGKDGGSVISETRRPSTLYVVRFVKSASSPNLVVSFREPISDEPC
ncbi:hypothetical protein BH09ACT1_BH09ACT1_06240 [soil metagenome]